MKDTSTTSRQARKLIDNALWMLSLGPESARRAVQMLDEFEKDNPSQDAWWYSTFLNIRAIAVKLLNA